MLFDFQKKRGALAINAGVQFFLLAMGLKINTRLGWLVCLPLLAAISLLGWMAALHRRRAIADTPTSRIASAAQGVVELSGRGCAIEPPLASFIHGLPCLWYRYEIEEKSGKDWRTVDSGESDLVFLLDDGSGQCLVDVEGAEVLTSHMQIVRSGNQRTTEWTLLAGDVIYVQGEFRTRGGGSMALDANQDMIDLLAEWKQNRATLLKRFDLNGDGEIDMQEWELARQAARREIANRHSELRNSADVHAVGRPHTGQPYLLSNLDPQRLARRYLLWSFFHLAAFLLALGAIPLVL